MNGCEILTWMCSKKFLVNLEIDNNKFYFLGQGKYTSLESSGDTLHNWKHSLKFSAAPSPIRSCTDRSFAGWNVSLRRVYFTLIISALSCLSALVWLLAVSDTDFFFHVAFKVATSTDGPLWATWRFLLIPISRLVFETYVANHSTAAVTAIDLVTARRWIPVRYQLRSPTAGSISQLHFWRI